ncbi:predicted protein [Coccidioides posadasii str. Silveira]|uniref:Predicted protein n=2 Tax=Coccidioides posadasii TaxID=199306 RepID=E9DF13_COCPS|nr:predicted protein [Coccidioides posadasii str. Silveira]KMM70579.1 hypothetical protein CPAG_06890 [Coccidioides posadasii RMSCC 3488]
MDVSRRSPPRHLTRSRPTSSKLVHFYISLPSSGQRRLTRSLENRASKNPTVHFKRTMMPKYRGTPYRATSIRPCQDIQVHKRSVTRKFTIKSPPQPSRLPLFDLSS